MRGVKSVYIASVFFFAFSVFFAGCAGPVGGQKKARNPLSDPNFTLPDYVSAAFEACGGRAAWSVTNLIKADCVVTFSRFDGSRYITEHHYEIAAVPGRIRVSAMEPEGMVRYTLTAKGIRKSKNTIPDNIFTEKIGLSLYAGAVLEITTAPMRLLDENFLHTGDTEQVKVEGDWYRSIGTRSMSGYDSETEAIFYQEQRRGLVDMVWFKQDSGDLYIAAKGHQYREFGSGVMLPTSIDIYRIDTAGISRGLIARIHLYNITVAGNRMQN